MNRKKLFNKLITITYVFQLLLARNMYAAKIIHDTDIVYLNYIGMYVEGDNYEYVLKLNSDSTFNFQWNPLMNNFLPYEISGKWFLVKNAIFLKIKKNTGFDFFINTDCVKVYILSKKKLKIKKMGKLKKIIT